MRCSSQLHVIHEFGILHHYLTSAKKGKAFIQPDLFFMNPHWLPSDHCFCFLCIHKSLFIFFPRSWILSSSSSCKSLCNLIIFRVLSAPFSFSVFLQVCGACSYLQSLWLSGCVISWTTALSFRGLKYAVLFYQTTFWPPHRTWNQSGAEKQYSVSHLLL